MVFLPFFHHQMNKILVTSTLRHLCSKKKLLSKKEQRNWKTDLNCKILKTPALWCRPLKTCTIFWNFLYNIDPYVFPVLPYIMGNIGFKYMYIDFLTLKMPNTTIVVCFVFCRLLENSELKNSFLQTVWTQIRSILVWIHTVCLFANSMFEKFAGRCNRRHKQTTFSDAGFLGILS